MGSILIYNLHHTLVCWTPKQTLSPVIFAENPSRRQSMSSLTNEETGEVACLGSQRTRPATALDSLAIQSTADTQYHLAPDASRKEWKRPGGPWTCPRPMSCILLNVPSLFCDCLHLLDSLFTVRLEGKAEDCAVNPLRQYFLHKQTPLLTHMAAQLVQ